MAVSGADLAAIQAELIRRHLTCEDIFRRLRQGAGCGGASPNIGKRSSAEGNGGRSCTLGAACVKFANSPDVRTRVLMTTGRAAEAAHASHTLTLYYAITLLATRFQCAFWQRRRTQKLKLH